MVWMMLDDYTVSPAWGQWHLLYFSDSTLSKSLFSCRAGFPEGCIKRSLVVVMSTRLGISR